MFEATRVRDGRWPEAGFAGREAQPTPVRLAAEKEGAHGGTMGSPMLL